jgi:hypothetical protein
MPDFASPSFGGFAFIGSLAALTQFSFRPKTLRADYGYYNWLFDPAFQRFSPSLELSDFACYSKIFRLSVRLFLSNKSSRTKPLVGHLKLVFRSVFR